jgi:very-short-patch-repair endonuclease
MTTFEVLQYAVPAVMAVVVIGILAASSMKRARSAPPPTRSTEIDISSRLPLTPREQSMYFRLSAAFPEQVVLAQVAMSALLKTKSTSTRATFDRKVIDFVLCSKAFQPLVVIELDDASHASKTEKDAARDALLQRAGYCVRRFANLPDEAELRRECRIEATPSAKAATSPIG